jgi:hypothetical protein
LGVLIALFLIFRQIVLWYYRVNERVELLKSIDEKLGQLVANQPSNLNVGPTIGEMRTD